MLAHKVFMTASAFHGQQLLRHLAACTLSRPYATSQAMLRLGAHDSNDRTNLAPLECWRDQLCVQSKGMFTWWPHAQAHSMYLPAEAVSINASSLHPICHIYFSLEAPALYLVVIRLLYMAHPNVCWHDLHSC